MRGIAAMAVVIFHYTVKFQDFYPAAKPPPFSFLYGFYGVHLFFIVSGFVILMSLERRNGQGFIKSRFIRLYPIFWVCVLLTFAVLSLNNSIDFSISPIALFINLTMLHDYVGAPAVDGVYWSLSYEIGFYVFMYAVFRFNLRRFIDYIPVVFVIFSITYLFVEQYVSNSLRYVLVLNSYAHLFACGIALYLIYSKGVKWHWVVAILAVPFIQLAQHGWVSFVWIAVAVGLSVLAVFWRNLNVKMGSKVVWPLIFLGKISYALYLCHQMIGYVLLAALQKAGLGAGVSIIAVIALMIALASVLTFYIERPAARRLKAMLG